MRSLLIVVLFSFFVTGNVLAQYIGNRVIEQKNIGFKIGVNSSGRVGVNYGDDYPWDIKKIQYVLGAMYRKQLPVKNLSLQAELVFTDKFYEDTYEGGSDSEGAPIYYLGDNNLYYISVPLLLKYQLPISRSKFNDQVVYALYFEGGIEPAYLASDNKDVFSSAYPTGFPPEYEDFLMNYTFGAGISFYAWEKEVLLGFRYSRGMDKVINSTATYRYFDWTWTTMNIMMSMYLF